MYEVMPWEIASKNCIECTDLIMPLRKVIAVIQGYFIYGDVEALQNL